MEYRGEMTRRVALQTVAVAAALGQRSPGTDFQIACMTIPFQAFSFERGVKGVAAAGFTGAGAGTLEPHAAVAARDRTPRILIARV